MNKKEALKRKIKSRFGTISNFSRLSGLNRYGLQKLFAKHNPTDKELGRVEKRISGFDPKKSTGVMTAAKFNALKKAVDEAGGVKKFCEDHPRFKEDTLFKILAKNRKMISGVTAKLLKHFQL